MKNKSNSLLIAISFICQSTTGTRTEAIKVLSKIFSVDIDAMNYAIRSTSNVKKFLKKHGHASCLKYSFLTFCDRDREYYNTADHVIKSASIIQYKLRTWLAQYSSMDFSIQGYNELDEFSNNLFGEFKPPNGLDFEIESFKSKNEFWSVFNTFIMADKSEEWKISQSEVYLDYCLNHKHILNEILKKI